MIGVSDERPGLGHSFRGGLLRTRRFAFAAGHKSRHQPERVRPKGAGDNNEFHDIEPTLAALVFGDKGLRFLQAKGEGLLGQPCGLARPDHKLAKSGLVGRMDRFADTEGSWCHQPGKLIPSSDYPKKG
jgi:hypothetical protein